MPEGLYIDAKQLTIGAKAFEQLAKRFPDKVSDVLNASALEIAKNAKRFAPADRGGLREGISADVSKLLEKRVTSHAPHSAYVEFGTGQYAAQFISSWPPDWQQMAAQYKGQKGTGGMYEFLLAILEWIERKGIVSKHATYRVSATTTKEGKLRTRRTREGTKSQKFEQDLKLAESIAYHILKYGIHPQPFLFPAYADEEPKLKGRMQYLLNTAAILL